MNRNFISVFVLLVTLSMFNADDSGPDFEPCGFSDTDPINVTMSDGELARFVIFGTISKDITTNTQVLIAYWEVKGADFYKACGEDGKPNCPVPSGTQFSITIDSVKAPHDYSGIYVFIGDDPDHQPFACAYAEVNPEFSSCGPNAGPLINVTVSPNPPLPGSTQYGINGTVSNDITDKTQLIISYGYEEEYTYKACGDVGRPNCPIPSGTQFIMTVDSVPVPDKIDQIVVSIGDPVDGGEEGDDFDSFGCASELFG